MTTTDTAQRKHPGYPSAAGIHASDNAALRCTITRLQAAIGKLVRDEMTARRQAVHWKGQADYWRDMFHARPRKR